MVQGPCPSGLQCARTRLTWSLGYFSSLLVAGGESIFGQPFEDEFHSRLRFTRRGLVAMASSGPNSNRSQFFITFDRCDELTRKHTIFGKVHP